MSQVTPDEHLKVTLSATRIFSESKVEEIIACLWTMIWVLLWANHAPTFVLWLVGIKAAGDHICSLVYAIREIREEQKSDKL